MIIRHLIAPLTAALVSLYAAHAGAQGAFPAPLPGQAAPAGASPFPPVNGAPAAPPAQQSAFPSSGAAPVGGAGGFGSGPPPQASGPPDACMKGFIPLREDAEKRGKMLKAAGERKMGPDEVCKLLANYGAAEVKMIKYIEANATKCGIPAQVGDQMKTGHKQTEAMQAKVCGVAKQIEQQKAAATPSLSDVLGSSAALPEATPQKKGGSTFDTLNGNVLTR